MQRTGVPECHGVAFVSREPSDPLGYMQLPRPLVEPALAIHAGADEEEAGGGEWLLMMTHAIVMDS